MNMAVSAIVACASSNFVSGLKNVTKRWMRLIMPGGAVSGVIPIATGRKSNHRPRREKLPFTGWTLTLILHRPLIFVVRKLNRWKRQIRSSRLPPISWSILTITTTGNWWSRWILSHGIATHYGTVIKMKSLLPAIQRCITTWCVAWKGGSPLF